MFIIVLVQHVSIRTESNSGPSKKTNSYLLELWILLYIVAIYKFICDPTAHFKHR